MKNSKVTVDVGMIASIVAAAVAKAMEAYNHAPVATDEPVIRSYNFMRNSKTGVRKSAEQFSEALGVTVTKKWVTLKPLMVENITLAERKIQAEAFKKAMALKVGYMQACYAGYHAVADSR